MADIQTYINKDNHSIQVCLNLNLDINEINDKINRLQECKEEKYKEVLEDILCHIELGLISLDSSGYLLDNIKNVL